MKSPTRKRALVILGLAAVMVVLVAAGWALKKRPEIPTPVAEEAVAITPEQQLQTAAPAKTSRGLSAGEVTLRLRQILSVISDPEECARQFRLVFQEADFGDPETGPATWRICVEALEKKQIPYEPKILREIGSAWAHANREGAWEFFLNEASETGIYVPEGMIGVLVEWWRSDHQEALAVARSVPDKTNLRLPPERAGMFLFPLYRLWIFENQSEAWASAKTEFSGFQFRAAVLAELALTFQERGPETTIAMISEILSALPWGHEYGLRSFHEMSVAQIVEKLAVNDFSAGISIYERHGVTMRPIIAKGLAMAAAGSGSMEGWTWLNARENAELLDDYGSRALRAFVMGDVQGALSAWQSANLDSREKWLSALVGGFAETAPAEAVRWSIAIGDSSGIPGPVRDAATSIALARWLSWDRTAAIAFLEERYATSPPSAEIAHTWATTDMDFALRHAQQNTSGDGRDQFLADVLTSKEWGVSRTPNVEVAMLIENTSLRQATVGRAARNWSATAPDTALNWASSLEDSGLRNTAVRGVMESWASSNPAAAQQHLNEFNGATKDQALIGFVHGSVNRSPADAAPWAAAISDATNRRGALESVFQRWFSNDRSAAEAWLNASRLPDSERQNLLRFRRN